MKDLDWAIKFGYPDEGRIYFSWSRAAADESGGRWRINSWNAFITRERRVYIRVDGIGAVDAPEETVALALPDAIRVARRVAGDELHDALSRFGDVVIDGVLRTLIVSAWVQSARGVSTTGLSPSDYWRNSPWPR